MSRPARRRARLLAFSLRGHRDGPRASALLVRDEREVEDSFYLLPVRAGARQDVLTKPLLPRNVSGRGARGGAARAAPLCSAGHRHCGIRGHCGRRGASARRERRRSDAEPLVQYVCMEWRS